MPLLGVNEIGELIRIADEEHRRVVADEVPIALLGVELAGKAPHVALGIGGAELARDIGEANDQVGLLADRGEDLGLVYAVYVVRHREGTIGAPAFGMHGAFRDALAVLVRQ